MKNKLTLKDICTLAGTPFIFVEDITKYRLGCDLSNLLPIYRISGKSDCVFSDTFPPYKLSNLGTSDSETIRFFNIVNGCYSVFHKTDAICDVEVAILKT
jgi:hypothetical protein